MKNEYNRRFDARARPMTALMQNLALARARCTRRRIVPQARASKPR